MDYFQILKNAAELYKNKDHFMDVVFDSIEELNDFVNEQTLKGNFGKSSPYQYTRTMDGDNKKWNLKIYISGTPELNKNLSQYNI